jgi:hypothetical protein
VLKVDTGGKGKKSSIRKMFNTYFGQLWVVELAYIKFFIRIHPKMSWIRNTDGPNGILWGWGDRETDS